MRPFKFNVKNIVELIRKCLNIDTDKINYLKEYIYVNTCISNSIAKIIWVYFKKTILSLKLDVASFKLNYGNRSGLHLCFAGTTNQFNALKIIVKNMEGAVFLSKNKNADIYVLRTPAYLISWFFLSYLFYKYFSIKRNERKHNLACYINDRFNFYGQFIWFVFLLKKMKPKSVIVANDHSPSYRLMKEACKFLNVPIIYIQHASVTEKFPKLDFDISLLEGEDALNKYRLKGIKGEAHLVGMPKFDPYHQDINNNGSIHSIGLSLNILDPEESIENLLREIGKAEFEYQLTIRPHPRDKRHVFFERMVEQYNCKISDSRDENSFEFLKRIDLNIACESSIHLEAALMNVYPVYYQFNNEVKDHYGYIMNNLITDVIGNPKQLINLINSMKNNKPDVRNRSKYYVSTVNSEYDGKSSELVEVIITNYFEN